MIKTKYMRSWIHTEWYVKWTCVCHTQLYSTHRHLKRTERKESIDACVQCMRIHCNKSMTRISRLTQSENWTYRSWLRHEHRVKWIREEERERTTTIIFVGRFSWNSGILRFTLFRSVRFSVVQWFLSFFSFSFCVCINVCFRSKRNVNIYSISTLIGLCIDSELNHFEGNWVEKRVKCQHLWRYCLWKICWLFRGSCEYWTPFSQTHTNITRTSMIESAWFVSKKWVSFSLKKSDFCWKIFECDSCEYLIPIFKL